MMRSGERWVIACLLRLAPEQEPLCGDLLEEIGRGRSHAWLWRQLLNAAVTAAGRHLLAAKRASFEAWALGCAMLGVLLFAAYTAVKLGLLVAGLAWTSLFAASQTAAADPKPSFEVASVKPNAALDQRRGGVLQPGRFVQTNVTLRQLIGFAYGTTQITGGPAWLDRDRFDVETRGAFGLDAFLPGTDGAAPRVYLMLQGLLEDRFNLAVHGERQQRPVYLLRLARRDGQLGPRLQRSVTDCDALTRATVRSARPPSPPPAGQRPPCSRRVGPGQLIGDAIDLVQLADTLSGVVDRPVLDRTGLSGRFNVELEWTADTLAVAGSGPPADAPPSLFTALREQLGLMFERADAPVDVLVVDRAEPPTAN